MPKLQYSEILDRIYEAAFVPDQWSGLLTDFADHIGGMAGFLFVANAYRSEWISSPNLAQKFQEFIDLGFLEHNSRITRVLERRLLGCTVADHELFEPHEMAKDPMYDFLHSYGGGWCVGYTFAVPSGDTLAVSFERQHRLGPFERNTILHVDQFRSHFARAALLASRLGLERARAATEAMNAIGLAAAVVGHSRRLIASNDLFNQLIPSQIEDRRERVRLVHDGADKLLASALTHIGIVGQTAETLSIAIPKRDEKPATVLHVVPVRRTANDIFSDACCLLVATQIADKKAPPAMLIQGLFDLTPAEARLARGLGEGFTLAELASQFGVGTGTLRIQLKSVFAKTGLSRQAELVALLGTLTLPGK
ncbi:helix-turn-helix transcriptional regulator [Beijerinckia mobilis]|uniref:helix-turn-helix transcriptional regulator n=1 Tax=Beijerinckia mobilis TaxID=231434 RepID=UPI00054F8A63|nr:helix-turn-helix transcriptional regulator [Beijerinckia mobilis]